MMAHHSKRPKRRPPLGRQGSDASFKRSAHQEFQLISPLSDLSNPSCLKPTPLISETKQGQRTVVLENVPHPNRISKNRTHVLANNAAAAIPVVNKKTTKKPVVTAAPAAAKKKKIKNKFAHRLDLMRAQTTRAVKQTVKTAVAKKAPLKKDAPPGKENKAATLGMVTRQPEESLGWSGTGATNKENALNTTSDRYFETLWREQKADGSLLQETSLVGHEKTPTIALDKAFENVLGLHRADDYFNRLAEQVEESPRLDQLESLASVHMQEDTTCVSYLISETSNASPALSKIGTVASEATVSKKYIAVEQLGKNNASPPPEDSTMEPTSNSPRPLEETNDSIFQMSNETRAKLLVQHQNNSRGSSNLIYSPETEMQGESIVSASLYTTESPSDDNRDATVEETKVNVEASVAPSAVETVEVESCPSAPTDDLSPVQLMGELVSLHSDKQSTNPSESESSTAESSTAPSPDNEESTKNCRKDHVRLGSLASFSSLPIEQDTSTIPFEEPGVSAIAEESISKLQDDKDHESSLEAIVDGSRLIACSDSDTASEENAQTDSEVDDDEKTEVIVAISKLPPSDEDSCSSKSTVVRRDDGFETVYSASEEQSLASHLHDNYNDDDVGTVHSSSYESEIIVSTSKLPKNNEGLVSHQKDTDETLYTASDMPKTKLHFSDASIESPSPPPSKESSSVDASSSEEEDVAHNTSSAPSNVTNYPEPVAEPVEETVKETKEEEDTVVIKTAVPTGRVFAPRAPGELLISVDLETLPTEDLIVDADEQSEASESTQASDPEPKAVIMDDQPKAINLIANPKALVQEERAKAAAMGIDLDDSYESEESSKATEAVEAKYEADVSDCESDTESKASDVQHDAVESVAPVSKREAEVSAGDVTSHEIEDQSNSFELATTKASDVASGYASDIMTLRATESSPAVLETIDSKTSSKQRVSSSPATLETIDSKPSVEASPTADYRNVALMNDEQKAEKAKRPAVNHLASMSPADSIASSAGGSPIPLVSEQALSNAAFLFSPSYANGKQRLLTRLANPPREMSLGTFAISTAQSRRRLSTFSARSRPAFSIPISSAPLNMSSIRPSQSSRSDESITLDTITLSDSSNRLSREKGQIVVNKSESSRDGGSESEKRVHFSGADECHFIRDANTSRVAMGTPVTVVSPPPIDRKISDLTEATLPTITNDSVPSPRRESSSSDGLSHRQRVAKILNDIEEDEETVDEDETVSKQSDDGSKGLSDSSPETAVHWTYREENGVLGAPTPIRSNARQGTHMAPTNSPRLRFKEAKNMFNKPATKVPIRSSPTMKYTKPIGNGAVHSRVLALNDRLSASSSSAELNNRLRSNRQPARKNPRRETGGENALAPRQATLEAPLFRNPIIMSYKDDTSLAPSEVATVVSGDLTSDTGVSTVASVDMKSETGVSTVVSADLKSDTGVSTVVSADMKSDTGVSTVVSADMKSDTGVSTVVSADLQSDTGVSTVVSADLKSDTVVSTVVSEAVVEGATNTVVSAEEDASSNNGNDESADIFTTMMMGSPEDSNSDEDDAFADARRLSDEFEHPVRGQSFRKSGTSLQSLLERDEQARKEKQHGQKPPRLSRGPLGTSLRSLVSEDPSTMSALTFETDKENSIGAPRLGSLGPKTLSFKDKATVNPRQQQQHAPPADLCLSPKRTTPLQARKWRTLAAAAQEQDKAKKGSSKKRGLLKERNTNIMLGGK